MRKWNSAMFNRWRLWTFHLGLAVCCTMLAVANASASEFPTRPVQLIIPWASGSDNVLRAIAVKAGEHLGQPLVVVNKPGVSGTLAAAEIARSAKADGYTIAQIPISVFRLPHLQPTGFDPRSDFSFIVGLSGYTSGVAVRADSPWQSWGELIAYAKSNPGKLSFGTSGVNTTLDITMKQIARKDGIQWTDVPFKGSSESVSALLGGHVDVLAGTSAAWGPFVDSGKFKLLATWGDRRTSRWPAVPTLKELGYGIVANSPYGLAGPKGMPPRAVKALHDAFKQALEDPGMQKTLDQYGEEAAYLSTDEYKAYAAAEYARQQHIVKDLNLVRP